MEILTKFLLYETDEEDIRNIEIKLGWNWNGCTNGVDQRKCSGSRHFYNTLATKASPQLKGMRCDPGFRS